MERVPQPQMEFESGYDRMATATEAVATARKMINERIDNTMSPEEREEAIKEMMQEIVNLNDNGYRHIFEEMGNLLTEERSINRLKELYRAHPQLMPEAANDEVYDLREAA